jgi:hypothetical protein
MYIPMTKVRVHSYKDCDFLSDRSIIVQLRKDGSTWINETKEDPGKLRSVLAEIYEYRNDKFVYLISDPEVSFGEFANFYNNVASSTDNLHIGLRTREIDREFMQCPQGSICALDWPDHEFSDPCVYSNIQLVLIPRQSLR